MLTENYIYYRKFEKGRAYRLKLNHEYLCEQKEDGSIYVKLEDFESSYYKISIDDLKKHFITKLNLSRLKKLKKLNEIPNM